MNELKNQSIILTSTKESNQKLAQFFQQTQAKIHQFPLLQLSRTNDCQEFDFVIQNINRFEYTIFFSKNGFKYCLERLKELKISPAVLNQTKIITIGEATKQYIEQKNLQVFFYPQEYNSVQLIQELNKMIQNQTSFFLPQSAQGNSLIYEELKKKGHDVRRVILYETSINERELHQLEEHLKKNQNQGWIIFMSPSAVVALSKIKYQLQLKIAAIGKTTLQQLNANKFKANIVCEKSTLHELYKNILQYSD